MKFVIWDQIQQLCGNGMRTLNATCKSGWRNAKKKLFQKDFLIEDLYIKIRGLQIEINTLTEENKRLADEAASAWGMLDEFKEADSQVTNFVNSLSDVFNNPPTQEELLSSIIITDDVGEA